MSTLKSILTAFMVVILVFTNSHSLAQTKKTNTLNQKTILLIQASGIMASFDELDQKILASSKTSAANTTKMNEATRTKFDNDMEAAIKDLFQSDKLLNAVSIKLIENMPETDIDAGLDYFSSSIGERIVGLENAAKNKETETHIKENQKEILAKLDEDPERKRTLEQMITQTYSQETGFSIVAAMIRSTFSTMSALGKAPKLNEAQMLQFIVGQKPSIIPSMKKVLTAGLTTTYHSLTNAELKTHLAFIMSKPGSKFYALTSSALIAVLSKDAREFGKKLAKELSNEKI